MEPLKRKPISFNKPTILFKGILAATPEQIFGVVKSWTLGVALSLGYELQAQPGKYGIDIDAIMVDDESQEAKPFNAGHIGIIENMQGSQISLSFWDWERNGSIWAEWNGFAKLPEAEIIFTSLADELKQVFPSIASFETSEQKTYRKPDGQDIKIEVGDNFEGNIIVGNGNKIEQ